MALRPREHAEAVKRLKRELRELEAAHGERPPIGLVKDPVDDEQPDTRSRVRAGRNPWRRVAAHALAYLLPSAVAGAVLGSAAWRQFPLEYELGFQVRCQFPDAAGQIELQKVIRQLQVPPQGAQQLTSAWPFGDLLANASVRFKADPATSAIDVRVQTRQPEQARGMVTDWLDERLATIGVNVAAERIDALLGSLPGVDSLPDGDANRYHRALQSLRDSREQLVLYQQQRAEKSAQLERLRSEPPPKGEVEPQRRREALLANIALQQDLRHLRARTEEVRSAAINDLTLCVQADDRIRPAIEGLGSALRDLHVRGVDARTEAVLPEIESFLEQFARRYEELRDVLVGSLAALQEASARNPQATLDVVDRLNAAVHLWMDSGEEELAQQEGLVDGLTDGQESSVRRVLIHNQLKRRLFALEIERQTLADRLAALRCDWNFRLDALARSVRGLSQRVTLQTRQIERRLQAEADEAAKRVREAEIASLQEVVHEIEQAEYKVLAGFLETFDLMASLEGTAVQEEVGRQRSLWMSELRQRLGDYSRGDLDGVVLIATDLEVCPEPVNATTRARWTAALGGGGGAACLLTLVVFSLFRRLLSGSGRMPDGTAG
ncbi:MAG: hypothetical protein JSU68_00405 [Phycisphaerales bacterium]|nr:MAG: hypothetical protein JSU68_00405 [Phycisphaerales bacterium]